MKPNQVLKINNNYFYLNNENQNLKSNTPITVNENKENNYIEYFDYIRIIN